MNKGEKLFFGRARRIELAKKVAFIVGAIIVIAVIISFLSTKITFFDKDVEFGQLISYMESKGYACRRIQKSGGSCVIKNADGTSYSFVRYDEGFNYTIKAPTYDLEIKHFVDITDHIYFRTTAGALTGYKDKYYECSATKGIVGELKECKTPSGEVLDSDVYIGVVEKALYDLDGILKASGYEYDAILNDYSWIKK